MSSMEKNISLAEDCPERGESLFQKFTYFCVAMVNQYLPDPFLFAVILTFFVFVAGIAFAGNTPLEMVQHWGKGFWSLLAFSMQMVLVLVTGSAMAQAPAFKKILRAIAGTATGPASAIMITSFVSLIANWINWGFGLVIGALLAREMAKSVKGVDYRLLVATGYTGLIVWHGGIAGSIPLALASATNLLAATGGAVTEFVPTSQTIFSTQNLFICIVILIGMPFVCKAMHPPADKVVTIDPKLLVDEETTYGPPQTPADKLERSTIIWALTAALGFSYLIYYFYTKGFALSLDIVNMSFLFIGILLHGTLRRYIDAVFAAAKNAAGIILQFPFYAGIMGMMIGVSATGSSLGSVISEFFVSISTPTTFPLLTFLSAGIVNFFVPSGGGQWAVQAPVIMPAAKELGVSMSSAAMAIAWGDAWTNMLQPFWALPALGVAGLSAKDIMGYCVITLIFGGLVMGAGFLIFP